MGAKVKIGLQSLFRLNLGGEGEAPDYINQQPPWCDLNSVISRNGLPYRSLSSVGIPFLFCDNTNLCFPDSTVDSVVTNGVPIDQVTWLGPSIPSSEIRRVLKTNGGTWRDNGTLVYTKP